MPSEGPRLPDCTQEQKLRRQHPGQTASACVLGGAHSLFPRGSPPPCSNNVNCQIIILYIKMNFQLLVLSSRAT